MKTQEIILMLTQQEQELFEMLQNAKLVFGEDSESAKIARARWSTTNEILKTIQNENA